MASGVGTAFRLRRRVLALAVVTALPVVPGESEGAEAGIAASSLELRQRVEAVLDATGVRIGAWTYAKSKQRGRKIHYAALTLSSTDTTDDALFVIMCDAGRMSASVISDVATHRWKEIPLPDVRLEIDGTEQGWALWAQMPLAASVGLFNSMAYYLADNLYDAESMRLTIGEAGERRTFEAELAGVKPALARLARHCPFPGAPFSIDRQNWMFMRDVLRDLGYPIPWGQRSVEATEEAVRELQEEYGLPPTGLIDEATVSVLLDRWREVIASREVDGLDGRLTRADATAKKVGGVEAD